MRFYNNPYPKHGDTRYKVFFAWLPVTVGLETRWLEKVSVLQEYRSRIKMRYINYSSRWINLRFEQQPLPGFKLTSKPPKHHAKV